jgi:hypothetical protein
MPGTRLEYYKDYDKNKRQPSPPKPRQRKALSDEQLKKKRIYNKAYNARMTEEQKERRRSQQKAYTLRKKEAAAKLLVASL